MTTPKERAGPTLIYLGRSEDVAEAGKHEGRRQHRVDAAVDAVDLAERAQVPEVALHRHQCMSAPRHH